MKSIIFVLTLLSTQLTFAQSISIKTATPKVTVMVGGKSANVQVKKKLVKTNGYLIESVEPKTLEELTKNMNQEDVKYKFEGKDYQVFSTVKGLYYIFIPTDKGLVKKKIG